MCERGGGTEEVSFELVIFGGSYSSRRHAQTRELWATWLTLGHPHTHLLATPAQDLLVCGGVAVAVRNRTLCLTLPPRAPSQWLSWSSGICQDMMTLSGGICGYSAWLLGTSQSSCKQMHSVY